MNRIATIVNVKASENNTSTKGKTKRIPDTFLEDPSLYLNRELTWLSFNERVLCQALDSQLPLLERLKFIAIVGSNLDEFFMKRIGGLKQQLGAGMTSATVDGRTAKQQILECSEKIHALDKKQRDHLDAVLAELEAEDIRILKYDVLSDDDKAYLRDYYYDNVFPLVTPQAIDPAHPFPFISNLSLNLLVNVKYPGEHGKHSLTRIKVPVDQGQVRFISLPNSNNFIPLEAIIRENLDLLLPDMEIVSCYSFRVTRNANTEHNEEHADDLLSMIESELRDRRFAPIVRLQVQNEMDDTTRGMLAAELQLDEEDDVYNARSSFLSMRDLMEIATLDIPELRDEPHHAVDHPELQDTRNIFHIIRDRGPLLMQHPYESFGTSVERFLKEASTDPKVRAIKMTLYRTSQDTKVVGYLIRAATNGKQVAVVVELKAKFDEAANIGWASRMEEAGVHVTYGVVGLKTHSKIILVVRNDYNGLKRYVHIGTGNYHAGTARLYADLGVLTNDEDIGRDATELFNYLGTGYTQDRTYLKLLPAPKHLKQALIEKINRERKLHSPETPGLIQLKMNALEDFEVTKALYKASRDGVKIDLIVRDTCRFRPGIPGLSESTRVVSIIGRFLEHTRIYYFQNGGDEEYFIGSADCMKRNLESRVEVVMPVINEELRASLRQMLDIQLADQVSAWEMDSEGVFTPPSRPEKAKSSQAQLIKLAEQRSKAAKKLMKGKLKKHKRS